MNEMIALLTQRRSCRKFLDREVPKELIDQVIEAGLYAPSAENRQSTKCIVIKDREVIADLSRINGVFDGNLRGDPFYGAKTVVLVVSDRTQKTWVEDGSLVLGNLLNAAHALGLGSCWIHWAKETMETPYGQRLRKKWELPEEYAGVGFCILGYPEKENHNKPPRKEGRVKFV